MEDGKGDYMAVGLVDGKAVFRYVHYFHLLYFLPKKLLKLIICYGKALELLKGEMKSGLIVKQVVFIWLYGICS